MMKDEGEFAAEIKNRQNSELLYKKFFETFEDGILILNPDTEQVEDVNWRLMKMLGYSREELLGKKLFEIDLFKDHNVFKELRKKEYAHYDHLSLQTKDGRSIDVEFISSVCHYDHQKAIQCNIHAVIRSQKTKREIIDDRENIHCVIESVGDGITVSDRDGHFEIFNRMMQEITGYTMEEANLSSDFNRLIYINPGERQKAIEGLRHVMMKKGIYETETTINAKNGQDKTLIVSTSMIRYKERDMFLSVYHDITARKQAEKALQEANDHLENRVRERTEELTDAYEVLQLGAEKYRIVADYTYDWEYWTDPDGRFIYLSPSCEKITGYSVQEFEENPDLMTQIVHPDDRQQYVVHRHEVTSGQISGDLLFRIISRDGQERWIEHLCLPVFDSKGKFLGKRGSNRDITERRKAEEERELMRKQLIQSEKLSTLGEMSAGIAHELNTPLNIVTGYLELMSKKLGNQEPYNKYLEYSLEGAEQCRQLINDFMSYARPQDSVEDNNGILDLNEVIRDSLRLIHVYKASNINLLSELDSNIPKIKGKKKELMQVFINLINNAIDAMPDGGTLTVLTRELKEKGAVEFRVADTGSGIPESVLNKIFDPFFTTKRPGKGTGLGLSIVKRITENHKGKICAESHEGKNTVFTGELPAA